MAFNLLIIALATLSFSAKIKVKHVDKYADIPVHDPEVIKWRNSFETWDKKGVIKESFGGCALDFEYGLTFLNKTKAKKGAKEDAADYVAIAADKVPTLKASQIIPDSEWEAIGKCEALDISDDGVDERQIAYTAYFRNEDDFYPSAAYNILKGPSKRYISYDDADRSNGDVSDIDGTYYSYLSDLDRNCHRGELTSYVASSRYYDGVVDVACYPNDFSKVPGYNANYTKYDDRVKGSPEIIKDECTGTGKFKAYLKKYTWGSFHGGNLNTLKRAIVRFGPVQAGVQPAKYDSAGNALIKQIFSYGSYYNVIQYGLFIGWNSTHLLVIEDDFNDDQDLIGKKVGGIEIVSKGSYFDLDSDPVKEFADQTFDDIYINEANVYGSGVSVVRAALGLIAAVLVLPALLL